MWSLSQLIWLTSIQPKNTAEIMMCHFLGKIIEYNVTSTLLSTISLFCRKSATKASSHALRIFRDSYGEVPMTRNWCLLAIASIDLTVMEVSHLGRMSSRLNQDSRCLLSWLTIKKKKNSWGVPLVEQWKRIRLGNMVLWVWSLDLLSGLRIWLCRELWCSLQMWLGSQVALAVV